MQYWEQLKQDIGYLVRVWGEVPPEMASLVEDSTRFGTAPWPKHLGDSGHPSEGS